MESRWGTPPSSPGPSQGQPRHPREPPKHSESCDPSPGESFAHPEPPRPGGQRTHLGRWAGGISQHWSAPSSGGPNAHPVVPHWVLRWVTSYV